MAQLATPPSMTKIHHRNSRIVRRSWLRHGSGGRVRVAYVGEEVGEGERGGSPEEGVRVDDDHDEAYVICTRRRRAARGSTRRRLALVRAMRWRGVAERERWAWLTGVELRVSGGHGRRRRRRRPSRIDAGGGAASGGAGGAVAVAAVVTGGGGGARARVFFRT